MTAEERYYQLLEKVDRAWDTYCAKPTLVNHQEFRDISETFKDYCTEVLIELMKENSDVLARLKWE